MPCFCEVPAAAARSTFDVGMIPVFPSVPLSLKLAGAIARIDPEDRLDMRIEAGFSTMTMPNIQLPGIGAAIQLAMALNLAVGNFQLDELPMMEMQMQQAAASIETNVWPKLGYLTTFKMQPLIQYAIVARQVLDLQEFGIDPIEMTTEPSVPVSHSFDLALTPPQFQMAQIMGGLPALALMNESLSLPPLGSPDSFEAMSAVFAGLSQLTPPNLVIPMPTLTKLALAMNSLAVIKEAFGDEPFSPVTMGRVEMMLQNWSRFGIPIPLEAMRLDAMLQTLPPMEDIQLGAEMASDSGGSMSFARPTFNFSPPKLSIAPFLNVVLALQGSLQMTLDPLEMEAFDMCSMCPCS